MSNKKSNGQLITIILASLISGILLKVMLTERNRIVSQRWDDDLGRLVVTFKSGRVIHVDLDSGVIDFDSLTA